MSSTHRLTRLKAVNRILRAASEAPVSSLATDGINDTNVAEDLLQETNTQVQLRGLNCNTVDTKINPDDRGWISVPSDTLKVDTVAEDFGRNLVLRGGDNKFRLFDVDNNTFVFTQAVNVRITVGLDFEDLPVPTQYEITDIAARIYQGQTLGDPALDALLREVAAASRFQSRREEINSRDVSIFRGQSRNAYAAVNNNRRFNLRSRRA